MAFRNGVWVPSRDQNGHDAEHPSDARERRARERAGREELAKRWRAGREYEGRKRTPHGR